VRACGVCVWFVHVGGCVRESAQGYLLAEIFDGNT